MTILIPSQAELLVTSYTEMIGAIKTRIGVLGIRYEDFDVLAGFPAGLSGKVFGPAQVKRLGPEKLFDAMRAASLMIEVRDDPAQLEKMRNQMAEHCQTRQANQARPANHASAISTHVLSRAFGHVLREARKKRWVGKSKSERSDHARRIANARWSKHRKRVKAAAKGARTRKDRLAVIAKPADQGSVI